MPTPMPDYRTTAEDQRKVEAEFRRKVGVAAYREKSKTEQTKQNKRLARQKATFRATP